MSNKVAFRILEDIARDLSGDEITFPTFLDITFQVRTALKDPDLSVDKLAKLVGAEPLMSAKVIRMANSVAMNPSGREIGDVKNAILRVGMEAVRTVSFAVAMEQLMKSKQMQPFEHLSQRLWVHTAHVAALCRVLARKLAKINGDEAMFAGLVCDLGVFYLMSRAANVPEMANDPVELHALLVGWHDQIGHALLSAMGLPEPVLEAVRDQETDREIAAVDNLSNVLFVAIKIANRTSDWRDKELDGEVDTSVLEKLFDTETLERIIEESEEEVQSLKAALGG